MLNFVYKFLEERRENGSPNGENNGGDENLICLDNNFHSNGNNGFDEDDWAPLPKEEQEKLSSQIGKLVLDRDLEKSVEERLDMLHAFFIKAKKVGTIQVIKIRTFFCQNNLKIIIFKKFKEAKTLVNEAERLELKTKAPLLLVDVLFDTDVVKQIQAYRNLLLRFCYKDSKVNIFNFFYFIF